LGVGGGGGGGGGTLMVTSVKGKEKATYLKEMERGGKIYVGPS